MDLVCSIFTALNIINLYWLYNKDAEDIVGSITNRLTIGSIIINQWRSWLLIGCKNLYYVIFLDSDYKIVIYRPNDPVSGVVLTTDLRIINAIMHISRYTLTYARSYLLLCTNLFLIPLHCSYSYKIIS